MMVILMFIGTREFVMENYTKDFEMIFFVYHQLENLLQNVYNLYSRNIVILIKYKPKTVPGT